MANKVRNDSADAMRRRIEEQAQAQRNADRRMKRIMIAVLVAVVVIAVAVIAFIVMNKGKISGETATNPVGAQAQAEFSEGQPVVIGEGSGPVAAVYFDYSCPHCAEYDEIMGKQLVEAALNGPGRLELHPVRTQNFVYNDIATGAILRTAVAERDKVPAFHDALLRNYLAVSATDGYQLFNDPKQALEQVLKVAREVGVADATLEGLNEKEAAAYLNRSSQNWADAKLTEDGRLGTPMYARDGKQVKPNPPAPPAEGATDEQKQAYVKQVHEYFQVDFVKELLG